YSILNLLTTTTTNHGGNPNQHINKAPCQTKSLQILHLQEGLLIPRLSRVRLPADPAPGHDPPYLDLARPEIVQLERLQLHLLALPALLPSPDLLLRAVPL